MIDQERAGCSVLDCQVRIGVATVVVDGQAVALACQEHGEQLGCISHDYGPVGPVVEVDTTRCAGWRLVVDMRQTRGPVLVPPGVEYVLP